MANQVVSSDGFTTRVANLTGCAIAGIVVAGGSGWAQATTTVTPSTGNSAWSPIVGGQLNTTVAISNAGSGYGVAPLVFVGAPPPGGVQATMIANLTSGTVSSITTVNQGAGYPTAPQIAIYPSPFDPNFLAGSAITNAVATCSLAGSSAITAVLCTNNGAPFSAASVPTLTISGGGSGATLSIVQLTTLTGATISGGGAGFNSSAYLTTKGGQPAATAAYLNPSIELTGYTPRPAVANLTLTGTTISALGTIYDGGLFAGTPTAVVLQGGLAPTTAATISLALGNTNATVFMQQLMQQPLSGPGVGLPYPQALYPANLLNGENQPATNAIGLAPGDAIVVPRGTWWIDSGSYCFVQVLDPVSGIWKNVSSAR